MATRKKAVYFFGDGKADGRAGDKALLGGKGANLAEMTRLGIPVPAGFSISTEICTAYYENDRSFPAGLESEVARALTQVEKVMGAKFGDDHNPLLVSVRSGARASMPGMMDTVLNLGLNDTSIQGLIEQTGNPRFAWDCYRRFVQMYGDVVLGLKPESSHEIDPFEKILEKKKKKRGVHFDSDLSAVDLKDLVRLFKAEIRKCTGHAFPEDPQEQLWGAIGAVFGSWMNDRAIAYRRLNGIPAEWGTAVNVQAMVFGNMGDDCGTGVAFTRDPATGEKRFYGEFLMNAQGEDVVAGTRTPLPIDELKAINKKVYAQLLKIQGVLERHYRDMQDVEFTIQKGRLWMLQTRNGKRTGKAAVRIAVDMVGEKLITRDEALARIDPDQIVQFLNPGFDPTAKAKAVTSGQVIARGLAAGPGAACGRIVFSAEDAAIMAAKGEPVILTRIETSPEDIKGMAASAGILTARGGMTSHAALVARQMGKVCVAGCGGLDIDYRKRRMTVGKLVLKEGDWISIDGTTGEVIDGRLDTRPSEVVRAFQGAAGSSSRTNEYRIFAKLMKWSDEVRQMNIRTNADQPDQAALAVAFGAEGIGLTRTEHMFFGEDRIEHVRRMILAETPAKRREALAAILPIQRGDFVGIFRAMNGRPVTIRTLDPPLHEFLPQTDKDIRELAKSMGVRASKLSARVASLHELNPMLGHRGCRLGIMFPEITEMQARAILEAACDVKTEKIRVHPEIMIPLVGHVNELREQAKIVRRVAEEVYASRKMKVDYLVGTMIELPRAALTADKIAEVAEFFSFGTNDLTQTTMGLSRDDAGKFLPFYLDSGILDAGDPFQSLDVEGVGKLLEIGAKLGRQTRPDLKIGICGLGLDYVSCSPFRVPIARLAAAQAALRRPRPEKKAAGRPAAKRAAAPKKKSANRKPATPKSAAKRPVARKSAAKSKKKTAARGKAAKGSSKANARKRKAAAA